MSKMKLKPNDIQCNYCNQWRDEEVLECSYCNDDINQNIKRSSNEIKETNNINDKITNVNEFIHPRYEKYHAMKTTSDFCLVMSYLAIISGTLSSFVILGNDGNYFLLFPIFLSSGFSWLFFKFLSESIIVICDIAYYLRIIKDK